MCPPCRRRSTARGTATFTLAWCDTATRLFPCAIPPLTGLFSSPLPRFLSPCWHPVSPVRRCGRACSALGSAAPASACRVVVVRERCHRRRGDAPGVGGDGSGRGGCALMCGALARHPSSSGGVPAPTFLHTPASPVSWSFSLPLFCHLPCLSVYISSLFFKVSVVARPDVVNTRFPYLLVYLTPSLSVYLGVGPSWASASDPCTPWAGAPRQREV